MLCLMQKSLRWMRGRSNIDVGMDKIIGPVQLFFCYFLFFFDSRYLVC